MTKYLQQIFFIFLSLSPISCSSGVEAFEDTAGGVKVNMGITPVDNPLVFSGAETKEKGSNTHQLLFVFHDKKTGKPFSPKAVSVKIYSPAKKVLADKKVEPVVYKDIGVENYSVLSVLREKGRYKVEMNFTKDGKSYSTKFTFRI